MLLNGYEEVKCLSSRTEGGEFYNPNYGESSGIAK
jgi:hypothetical protein